MLHPMGVVVARTGLTPDVIRVWERRYGVVAPARDEVGRRVYTDEDVERLRLLARATSMGRGIGQVAGLGVSDLRALVRADEAARAQAEAAGLVVPVNGSGNGAAAVERSLERARLLDAAGLEAELTRAATLLGLSHFLEGVVAPLFRRVGDEWHAGRLSVAQEHLATGVASKLVSQLLAAVVAPAGAPSLVVATPEGEQHEIGALMAAATAGAAGWRVTYVGGSVPAADIVAAAVDTEARCVALSVVFAEPGVAGPEVEAVRTGLPSGVDLLLGGESARGLVNGRPGVEWLPDLEALRVYLAGQA
jgi:MerR family transcriptional regulator, light-induced transcriptional regulator